MKFTPFNKERALLPGAKVVVMPDVVTEPEANTLSDVYPFKCKVNGEKYTFTDNGSIYNGEHIGIRLAMLDETPEEVTGEFTVLYHHLTAGEIRKEGDEFYLATEHRWKVYTGGLNEPLHEGHPPYRRRITLPLAPASPWVKYSDRKPTKEDADSGGWITAGGINRVNGNDVTGRTQWDTELDPKDGLTHFLPAQKIPPLPKPRRDFQKDFLDPKNNTAAMQLWAMLDDDTRARVEQAWRKENQ